MLGRTYSSQAVVLLRRNYGEADRILVVYSKDFGKLRLLAKGVRKPKSKKRGHIEVFSKIKFSASRGKSMDLITEAELLDSYEPLRKDLKKMSVAYYLCEVVDKVMREEEKNVSVFDSFLASLDSVGVENNLRSVREQFLYEILTELGFWPHGKRIDDADKLLSEVIEWDMSTVRVGKKILDLK